jgi:cysteine synthase
MADTVTGPTILQQNDKRVTIKIVVQSDGTGGTTVFGDVSALAADEHGNSVSTLESLVVYQRTLVLTLTKTT